jgi:transforming growth factor-beta-induced protein
VLTESLDIVERAIVTEQTETLTAAVVAGDLVTTLQGDGPFTVFAPINEAFAALGTERLDVLLDPANQALLQKVLTYHVVPGDVRLADVVALGDGASVATVEGTEVTFDLSDPQDPRVNGASIIATDIVTENGVIHLIDGVLTENLDIVDQAVVNGFSTLVSLVAQQELVDVLRGDNMGAGYTVFAPTNAAFEALAAVPEGDALTQVLLYHVVGATVFAGDLTDGQIVTTANAAGDTFTVNIGEGVTITDGAGTTVNVVLTDVEASNGVIHVVDAVLLPPPAGN